MTRSISAALLSCAALLFAGLWFVGCRGGGSSRPPILSKSALNPDHLGMKSCSLEIAGSKFKADIRESQQGEEIKIDLLAHDTVYETERYLSGETAFSVADIGGERFDPPIPLVKYPMHVGDPAWDWSGKYLTGPAAHAASAKVTTSSEDLPATNFRNVIRVDVDLSFDSGARGVNATRKLSFWIAPGRGVVKRAFGDYSKRDPLEE